MEGVVGGKEMNQKDVRGAIEGRKNKHDWLYLKSINSNKHLPQRPFTGKFFLDDI